jgi:hypothetical protein
MSRTSKFFTENIHLIEELTVEDIVLIYRVLPQTLGWSMEIPNPAEPFSFVISPTYSIQRGFTGFPSFLGEVIYILEQYGFKYERTQNSWEIVFSKLYQKESQDE